MDQSQALTAADVVNEYDEADLARVLREYGDERYARRIARAIVDAPGRSTPPTTLADIVRDADPGPGPPPRRPSRPGARSRPSASR